MIFGESGLKDLYRKAVWGPLREGLEAAPPLWEVAVVRGMGRTAAIGLPAKVARVSQNMERGLGPRDDLRARARDTFATHFGNQYVGFLFGKCDASTWPRYLELRGLAQLVEARERGRGVVLTHPHMGPAQLPLHVLGLLGWPMHQVGGGKPDVVLSPTGQWAADTRARLEERIQATLHDGHKFLRPLLRALKDGEVVMTACDGTGGGDEMGRRLVQPVLGQPMGIPLGPVWMAWKSGAPLLTVRTFRARETSPAPRQDGGEGRAWFVSEIGPELVFDRSGDKEAVFRSGTAAIAAYLDQSLRTHPGDWHFWDAFQEGGLLHPELPA